MLGPVVRAAPAAGRAAGPGRARGRRAPTVRTPAPRRGRDAGPGDWARVCAGARAPPGARAPSCVLCPCKGSAPLERAEIWPKFTALGCKATKTGTQQISFGERICPPSPCLKSPPPGSLPGFTTQSRTALPSLAFGPPHGRSIWGRDGAQHRLARATSPGTSGSPSLPVPTFPCKTSSVRKARAPGPRGDSSGAAWDFHSQNALVYLHLSVLGDVS